MINENIKYAPIVLFVYNRAAHTEETVKALLKNKECSESELYIYSDSAKNSDQHDSVEKVRNYIRSVNGFKNVTIREQEVNRGLSASIINGVTEIVNKFDRVIVLEDDLIVSPYFLDFMNRSLEKYESDDRIACIHGYIYPVDTELPTVFFLKGADCWGWATWKRAWNIFEPDGKKLHRELQERNLQSEFDFDGSYPYYKMMEDQSNGLNQSWAVRWYASVFIKGMMTLYPGKSLVHNIGLDSSGTHCSDTDIYNTAVNMNRVAEVETSVEVSQHAREAFKRFFKGSQSKSPDLTIFQKLKNIVRPVYNLVVGK
jgi:hypothetical protein